MTKPMNKEASNRKARIFVYEDIKVHMYEVDYYRVVHNARMHVFFDIGRFKILSHFFTREGSLEKSKYTYPVVRDACKFSRFGRLGDSLVIETRFDYNPPLRFALFRFHHRVLLKKNGAVIAQGNSEVGVCDPDLHLLGSMPDEMENRLCVQIEHYAKNPRKDIRVLLA